MFVAHTASRQTLSPSTTSQVRTITDANLITAADLPSPIGGGKVIEYHRNAPEPGSLSICQPQPLATLGASSIKSRSFQARYPAGQTLPTFLAGQTAGSLCRGAAICRPERCRARQVDLSGRVANCLAGGDPAKGTVLRPSFDWTPESSSSLPKLRSPKWSQTMFIGSKRLLREHRPDNAGGPDDDHGPYLLHR